MEKYLTKDHGVDVFIPCTDKDLIKLPYCIQGVLNHMDNIKDIHITTPHTIPKVDIDYPIYYHLDKQILSYVQPLRWRFRPNWIFQQYLKLFQDVTSTDYYFVVDTDVVINRKFELFENDHPIWNYGWEQNEPQYMNFNKVMCGFGREANHTFISDTCFFNKKIVNEMLERFNYTKESFIEKSYEVSDISCHIGEPELYGNYCEKYLNGLYISKPMKQHKLGKCTGNSEDVLWMTSEIENTIQQMKNEDYDVLNFHTWTCDFRNNWEG